MINHKDRIMITGGAGFLGKFVVQKLKQKGYNNLFIPRSKQFDLRNKKRCEKLVRVIDVVIHLAAVVGGIGFNQKYPATLFHDNLLMGLNLLDAAAKSHIKKFVAVGTVCAYPKYTPVPFSESSLWDGYPEETNAPYGLAKKMLLVGCQAYRKPYNLNGIFLLPVNLYGPHDNFHPLNSHVIPALIRKIHTAKIQKHDFITIWGTGMATREFLCVEDCAEGIIMAMEKYNSSDPVNLGSGKEISIFDLVKKLCLLIGYQGRIEWDKTKPDGQPRRLLNVAKAKQEFGFVAKTSFSAGLKNTYEWYLKHYA